jgi:molecular chaperone DnaJ
MHLKDYYKILGIEPSATTAEIRQAYRRLAHLHHPDKNDDHSASLVFAEIKEAYEVLTNPTKKEQYLQKRWYNQSIGKKKTQVIRTPVTILKEALELERYVSKLDVHRLDRQGLFEYMMAEFDNATLEQLKSSNEPDVSDQVVYAILKAVRVLKASQAEVLAKKLYDIASNEARKKIDATIHTLKRRDNWENKELLVVLIITILICFLIWLST